MTALRNEKGTCRRHVPALIELIAKRSALLHLHDVQNGDTAVVIQIIERVVLLIAFTTVPDQRHSADVEAVNIAVAVKVIAAGLRNIEIEAQALSRRRYGQISPEGLMNAYSDSFFLFRDNSCVLTVSIQPVCPAPCSTMR